MKNSSWTKPLSLLLVLAITLSMSVMSAFAGITSIKLKDGDVIASKATTFGIKVLATNMNFSTASEDKPSTAGYYILYAKLTKDGAAHGNTYYILTATSTNIESENIKFERDFDINTSGEAPTQDVKWGVSIYLATPTDNATADKTETFTQASAGTKSSDDTQITLNESVEINFIVDSATGKVTAEATGGNIDEAGDLTYTWTGGTTGTTFTPILGQTVTCTVTGTNTTGAGKSNSVIVYKVDVASKGATSGDLVEVPAPYGKVGDTVNVKYNFEEVANATNGVTFSAKKSSITLSASPIKYTIDAADADASTGIITITATFQHELSDDTGDNGNGDGDNNGDGTGGGTGGGSDTSSSSSSSSSGGGGSSGGSTTTTIPQPVTVAQGISAVNSAVNGVATLRNVTEISLSTLQAMVRAAGARSITINADSRAPDGSIDVRITFNPADATRTINLSASTLNSPAVNARATFARSFSNPLSTVSLSHTGAFGMNLRVAAKLNPALRNSKNLVFYIYDPATNRYSRLQTTYRIDANRFIHFLTNQGGVVIISDGALKKK